MSDDERERQVSNMLDADRITNQNQELYLRQWFRGAALSDIRADNVREFVCWAFFVKPYAQLNDQERVVFEDIRIRLQNQSKIIPAEGFNPNVSSMKLTEEPYSPLHRPLILYATIRLVHAFTARTMKSRGFTRHKIGSNTLHYYYRPQLDHSGRVAEVDLRDPDYPTDAKSGDRVQPLTPIVLVHGVGVGVFPYLHFLKRVGAVCGVASRKPNSSSSGGGRRHDHDRSSPPLFAIELPYISMNMDEHVPSVAETVAAITEMLTTHGITAKRNAARAARAAQAVASAGSYGGPVSPVHVLPSAAQTTVTDGSLHADGAMFVGHSFGTIVSGWVSKRRPHLVHGLCMIDPVVFLLNKPDVCYNFCYKQPESAGQLAIHYFASTELYILHTMRRHFWWWEQIQWASDCPPNRTAVCLASRDQLVPVDSVRQYLTAKQIPVTWMDNGRHAQFLAHRTHFNAVVNTCAQLYEAVLSAPVGIIRAPS